MLFICTDTSWNSIYPFPNSIILNREGYCIDFYVCLSIISRLPPLRLHIHRNICLLSLSCIMYCTLLWWLYCNDTSKYYKRSTRKDFYLRSYQFQDKIKSSIIQEWNLCKSMTSRKWKPWNGHTLIIRWNNKTLFCIRWWERK